MNFVELAENIEKIKLSTAGTKHAKNKPLLILYALEQIRANNSTKLYFYEIETPYSKILEEFSVSSNSLPRPHYAFYRLKKDFDGRLWEITDPNNVLVENSKGDVKIVALRDAKVKAGFTKKVLKLLENNDYFKSLTEIVCELFFEKKEREILSKLFVNLSINSH